MKGVSISVCCYNSVHRLGPTLAHLANQQVAGIEVEVLIIDNASTDDTFRRAKDDWAQCNSRFSFRIIEEPLPGLSNARKRAVAEAKYEMILFCDDDNWLTEQYVQSAYNIMSRDATIGILGGCGIPVTEVTPPDWFERYRRSYALGAQNKYDGYLPDGINIYGAGMMLRKGPLEQLYRAGFSSVLSGRKGKSLATGEDIEICIWYRILGYKLYYSGALTFQHFIPVERLTESYFLNRSFEKGKTEAIFLLYRAMLEKVDAKWIKRWYLWYWELFKRVAHYCLALLSFNSFDSRVKRKILISSIRFRASNLHYLKKTNELIISLSHSLKKSE